MQMKTDQVIPGQESRAGSNNIVSLFLDRRLLRGSILWVIIIFLMANIIVVKWHRSLQEQRRENLLVSLDHSSEGGIRWDMSAGENMDRYWSFIPDSSTYKLVILAGMSQMYAINEGQPNDKTISENMDDALSIKGIRVFGMAAPNLDNEEATLLLLSTLSDPRTRPDVFIYGVCFDKFRNIDLRPGYQKFMENRPALRSLWLETAMEYKGRYPLASEKMSRSLNELAGDKEREGETMDTRLREWTSRWLPVVSARADLNAVVQNQLFLLRNWVFNIKPTSKRPIIEGRFVMNKEFLEMMVDIAGRNGVTIILYVIPLNPLAESPYIPEQYADFKFWLEGFCKENGVPFANVENVVPTDAWGEFMGGPDFKHFKEEGHRLPAKALLERFGPIILRSERRLVRVQ